LQNKLNQLLNKCQQLSKHKVNLFKTIHQIANQFKPNNNNINNNNNNSNNESDKQLTPLSQRRGYYWYSTQTIGL